MSGCDHWQGRGSMAGARKAGPEVGAGGGVPMATPAKDGHYGDGRGPGEWDWGVEEETWIWWVKQVEFGS